MTHMGKPGPDPTVTDDEIVEAAQSIDDPCFTAREIEEKIDLNSVGQVRTRLNSLVDNGVMARKFSGSGNVYWLISLAVA